MARGPLGSLLFEMKFWARYLLPGTRYVAVYYPTPHPTVARMLELTECGPGDVVFDLGCGDGRVLVAAAHRGARAVGIELDAELAAKAEAAVRSDPAAAPLCRVVRGDAAGTDVSSATILALYLSDRGNRQLLRAVGRTLRPGTKVCSNFFPVEGWERHLIKTCLADPTTGPLHLYRAPGPGMDGS